jgi:phenylacetate-coenzyme A ligase PaaK-like adenylate-forming protein
MLLIKINITELYIFTSEIFFKKTVKDKLQVLLNQRKFYSNKNEIMKDLDNSSNSSINHKTNGRDLIFSKTSGTSGQIGAFINDRESWIRSQAILFTDIFYPYLFDLLTSLFVPNNISLSLLNNYSIKMLFVILEGEFMTYQMSKPVFNLPFISSKVISSLTEKEELIRKINEENPQILHIYPSILEDIFDELNIQPILIITGSEHLSYSLRQKLEKKFTNTKIIETYGSTECVFMGVSCEKGNIHLNNVDCIIELVDKNNNIITDYNVISDHILLTNLINTYQPLVKYKLEDSLEYIECNCNKNRKAVKIHGRSDDVLYFIDIYGIKQKHTPIAIESIFIKLLTFTSFTYQIIHRYQNYLEIIINGKNLLRTELTNSLDNYFTESQILIRYVIKYNCERIVTGNKIKQVINLVN